MPTDISAVAIAQLAIGLLLLLGLAAEAIGRRTAVPGVTLQLCLGIAVGPAAFDLLPADAHRWFPVVTDIALVMVGFLIGGEFTRERIHTLGRTVLIAAVAQAAVTFALVAGGLLLLGFGTPLSLTLAGIATATAPAATVAVVHELGLQGRFSRILMGVVAVDDVIALLAFALALSVASGTGTPLEAAQEAGAEILGAVALGAVLGMPMAWLTGRIRPGYPSLEEALGIVLILTALSSTLAVSPILAAVVLGAVVSNLARHHERPFHEIEHIERPFLVVFFVLAGASLEWDMLLASGSLGIAYVLLRSAGKISGGWLGGARAGLPSGEAAWLGVALLPQAGVALGLALAASERLPEGPQLLSVVIFATIVFELTGPIGTRAAVERAEGRSGDHSQVLPPRKRRPRHLPRWLRRGTGPR
ncbi:cation:proton antiporter [Algiphilus sp.]|uniref:cation:proton antiporter n=1 Tax=Algiphilus sp. TaxID=1872431 RepID=UPI003B52C394